ncbi:MAG: phosphatase PAP2 family protein [Clostridia bacterium]|nr:phosphatase PAP2 family protein [Clostridia bacterium]
MTIEFYSKILNFMNQHTTLKKITVALGKGITIFTYIYAGFIATYTFFFIRERFLSCFLVSGISFILVSILRLIINAPRPYEKYALTPLYNKKTKGKSFPSRHTFSIFIIAFTSFIVNAWLGWAFMFIGVILAATRVLCGVHFVKDVIAGMVCAIIAALFLLI